MITSIILLIFGLLIFKLAGGLGTLFAIGLKILGIVMMISAVGTFIGAL